MSTFTPGPWEVREKRVWEFTIASGTRWPIATVAQAYTAYDANGSTTGISQNTIKANACLIAAAPDLYGELSHLVRLLEPLEQDGSLNVPGLATLNGARTALAKAGPT